MVLVKENLEFKLISTKTDNEGRYILLEAVPNKVQEQCSFYYKKIELDNR